MHALDFPAMVAEREILPQHVTARDFRLADLRLQRSPFTLVLSVVVVSADSGAGLRECVASVLKSELALELILVDNDSQDGMPEAIERAHQNDDRLRVIYNRANLGFGAAVNIGARAAHGESLLILNPDCVLGAGDLEKLLSHLEDEVKPGLVGAVVCDAAGRPDPASWRHDPLFGRALKTLFGAGRGGVAVNGPIPGQAVAAEAVSGAVMLLPRLLFQRLGGFDEGYFLHCEDLDLCRRVRDEGYPVRLAGDVRVLHGKGGSSRHRPVFVSRWKHRGMWRWFRKFDPAARNPLLASLVWLGIWSHFVLKVPTQLLRRRS